MNNHPPCLFLLGHPMFLLWHRAHPTAPTAAGDSQGCVQGSRWFPRRCCLAHSWLVFCKIHAAGTIHTIPQSPSYSKTDTCSEHLKTPPCLSQKEAATTTGLAFIQSLDREQACRGSEGVTHGGYKTQVTWSHLQHCCTLIVVHCWLDHICRTVNSTAQCQHSAELLKKLHEPGPYPKIQDRQQLMEILPQEPNAGKSFRQHFSTSPLLSHSPSI